MPAYPLSQLERLAWDQLDGNQGEFPEPNVRMVLNQGLMRVNSVVGFKQITVTIPGGTVAGQNVYARPSGVFIPLRVDFGGQELEKTSFARIARRHREFATESSTPSRWCLIGLSTIMIHPADSVGGGVLDITGVANMTQLVNQSDLVEIENQFAEILTDWAKARLLLKEGGKLFADATETGYQGMISKLKALVLWQEMKFPEYWILKEANPGAGKGA